MEEETVASDAPRPPRNAVAWLVAAALLPPACLLVAGADEEYALLTVSLVALMLIAVSVVIAVRRHRFSRPVLAVTAAIVLLGWAALSVIGVSMEIGRLIENSHGVECRTNLKEIGIAVHKYAEAHDGDYPGDLAALVREGYIADLGILICPKSDDEPSDGVSADKWSSYTYVKVTSWDKAHSTGAIPIAWDKVQQHISGSCNVLYADAHVANAGYPDLAERLERSRDFYATQPQMPPVPERMRAAAEEVIEKVRDEVRQSPIHQDQGPERQGG